MLRGAIDIVTEEYVAGWVYSAHGDLRHHLVLAFVDESCVGAATVSIYRPDLKDAGLADGFLGFHIPIAIQAPDDVHRIHVKLDGSDASLLQRGSKVAANPFPGLGRPRNWMPRKTACLKWMLTHGWMEQPEYDFLEFFDEHGVYERPLTLSNRQRAAGYGQVDGKTIASGLLALFYMMEVEVAETRVAAVSHLSDVFCTLQSADGEESVIAVQSNDRFKIGVEKGSHRHSLGRGTAETASETVYHIGPDRLLLLNGACRCTPRSTAPANGINVYYVVRPI